MNKNLDIFLTFAKIGVMTFGGGYAMLPIMQRELVERRKWAGDEELIDYYAIAQCTPGVIAVNTATFVGRKQNGISGGIFATLGVVFPSLVIITLIAAFLNNFAYLPIVRNAFAGIRVCVCILVLNAVIKLLRKAVVDIPTGIIFSAVFVLAVFLDLSPIIFVVAAGISGVLIKALGGGRT
ncbi:MAG: chromate transporter [Oscillospiraceae bacterium]